MRNNAYITNYWHSANYGAHLTAYALYTIVKKLGFNVNLVNLMSETEQIRYDNFYAHKHFIDKYCTCTKPLRNYENLCGINKNAVFITGSDQVFRKKLEPEKFSSLMLDYTEESCCKIALSASFGVSKEVFLKENYPAGIEKMKDSLNSFNFISVRENEGIEILKDIFGIKAEYLIDPVFILDKKHFDGIAAASKTDFSGKIASYMFYENEEHKKAYEFLSKKYNAEIESIYGKNMRTEDWLQAVKSSKFLITNSFHGMSFALIFNKPFICLQDKTGASSRFESIFKVLGIENQCADLNDVYKKDCIFKIDYEKVNEHIENERQKGLELIKKALNSSCGSSSLKNSLKIKYLEERLQASEKQSTMPDVFKTFIWNRWLECYYKYLPEPVKNIIRFFRKL